VKATFSIQAALDGARDIAKRRSYIFDKDYSK
jgi:[NiFe] hydrogenase diaphorase moiety large subunit